MKTEFKVGDIVTAFGLQDVVLKISKKKPFKQTSEYLMTPFGL